MERYRSGHNGTVLKTVVRPAYRGFESHSLRHFFIIVVFLTAPMEKYSSWWRGAPAKGVGRVTGAGVRVSSSPPKSRSKERDFFCFKTLYNLRINHTQTPLSALQTSPLSWERNAQLPLLGLMKPNNSDYRMSDGKLLNAQKNADDNERSKT